MPPLKDHRFAARLLVLSAVLLPTFLCAAAAWLDYRVTLARAGEYVATTANALAHQTEETLQTADLILLRALDHIDGMDWHTISQSRAVHDFLAETATHLPAVQSVFLVDPAGYNSASSRAFPMEAFDDRDREYYIEAKKGADRLFVSTAFLGQKTGQPGFTVSRPRLTNGQFDGVAVVTFSPAAFQEFYEAIALDPGVSAALVRTDGSLLVRYPEIGSAAICPPVVLYCVRPGLPKAACIRVPRCLTAHTA